MVRESLMLALLVCQLQTGSAAALAAASRSWDVTLITRENQRHTLRVAESESVLAVAEAAGLLPGSDCRRGNCLSCAARVVAGSPFALSVATDTALCTEAHCEGIVLLCSAFPRGPGVELRLDADGEAWEIQHNKRWQRGCEHPPPREQRPPAVQYHDPDDLMVHLERCRDQACSSGSKSEGLCAEDAEGEV